MQLLTGAEACAVRDRSRAPRAVGVSAVIVNYNGAADVLDCIASLQGQGDLHEIIVVDNASPDGSLRALCAAEPPAVIVASDENLGFGGGANLGAACAAGDVLLILNPDTRLTPGSVHALAAHVRATGAVVGPVTVEADHRAPKLGEQMDWLGMPKARTKDAEPLFYIQGSAVAISAELYESIGGFDERLFLFAEDLELCWRARIAGHDVATVPGASVLHQGGGSIGGGYLRANGRSTSDLRFGMRERNTLTVFLTCAPMWLLPFFAPVYIAKVLLTAVVVAAMGRRQLARDLVRGIGWNVRQLPSSLHRRRSCPAAASRTTVFVRNSTRGLNALSIIRSDGLPHFVK